MEAWIAKGDILMLKDNPDEALAAYDRALELHRKAGNEPLAIQVRRRQAFTRILEKRGVTSPEPALP
jgi:predicted RNA polymerase sigma factor